MSRTHRKHASLSELAKRGATTREREERKRRMKSHKQTRVNERAQLRKEYR